MQKISRTDLEQSLADALSRQIGYTTGAYSIRRIASVTQVFDSQPAKYQLELLKKLTSQGLVSEVSVSEKYAAEILNFSISVGLIKRLTPGSTPNLSRLVIEPVGLSYRAALSLDLTRFADFLLIGQLLEHDSDAFGLLLDLFDSQPDGFNYRQDFFGRTFAIRRDRADWLNNAFSNSVLRRRIVERIPWATIGLGGKVTAQSIEESYGRHHATPRKGWLEELALLDEHNAVTGFGRDLVRRLRGGRKNYFWLGPPEGCQEQLRIPAEQILQGPFGPAWNVLRPSGDVKTATPDLVADLHQFMIKAFPFLRLSRANQAPLGAIFPYLHFLEHIYGLRVDRDETIRRVITESSGELTLLAGRETLLGHYHLRHDRLQQQVH